MNTYTSKQLGLDLKRWLSLGPDLDVIKIAKWADYLLYHDVDNHPDNEANGYLSALSMMQLEPAFEYTIEQLNIIANCLIEGKKIDLYQKDPFKDL